MNAKVADLMVSPVMTTTAHQTFGHVKNVLRKNGGSCMPVVNPDHEPIGMVTASDLLHDHPDGKSVSSFMTKKVYTVAQHSDVSLAARIMRNHKIHHVVVTHKKKVVGIISSYDLLKLVEDHRFVMKNGPTESKKSGKRGKLEIAKKPK
jgi:CBS domain-containing protein